MPKSLSELPVDPNPNKDSATTDEWGRPLGFSYDLPSGEFTLSSLGRDGVKGGTGDDADIHMTFASKPDYRSSPESPPFNEVWPRAVIPGIGEAGEPKAKCSSNPPELGIAVAVDGRMLEIQQFAHNMGQRISMSNTTPPTQIIEMVPFVSALVCRIDATTVVARRIDGRAVSTKDLMDELAKPTPIVFAKPGEQLNPPFAKLFKPESLVLVLPPPTPPPFALPTLPIRPPN